MNQKTILVTAVLACTATAFIAGRIIRSDSESPDHGFDDPSTHKSSSSKRLMLGKSGRTAGQSRARDRDPHLQAPHLAEPLIRMEVIMTMADPAARAEAWLRFVRGLDAEEVEEVAAGFHAKHHLHISSMEYDALLSVWATYDPEGALNYHTGNRNRPKAQKTLLRTWATTNPEAAMAWVQGQSKQRVLDLAPSVIRGVASVNPNQAMQLAKDLPADYSRFKALGHIVGAQLKNGTEATQQWVMNIEDESMKAQAAVKLASALAKTNPKDAADWLIANPVQGSSQGMARAMQAMVKQDPQGAIDYYSAMGDGELRSKAFTGILSELNGSDPRAALDFINANPSTANDRWYSSLAVSGSLEQPEVIAEALDKVQSLESQNRGYQRFMSRWLQSDFEAAANWVQQNSLPESISGKIGQLVERHRVLRQHRQLNVRELPNGQAFEFQPNGQNFQFRNGFDNN